MVCDTTGDSRLLIPGGHRVRSPVQCLDSAIKDRPRLIVVRFGPMPIREREALVELCAVLKGSPFTRTIPLLAVLWARHRRLMAALKDAGADYIRFAGPNEFDSVITGRLIDSLGSGDRVEPHLAKLCPFLHYKELDSRHEMTVCGAYLDRMVIGGRRLHDMCELEIHQNCEYYLNPRGNS